MRCFLFGVILIFGLSVVGATEPEPEFVICGTTQIPVVAVGYTVHLTLDLVGNIDDLDIRLTADLDGDGDVDLEDYAIFAASYTGPQS